MIDLEDYAYTRHMKLVLTAAAADGAEYKVVCSE